MASDYNLTLIEDDTNCGLSFRHNETTTLKALDHEHRVIYCSSLSKSVAPALRVGWMIAEQWTARAAETEYVINMGGAAIGQHFPPGTNAITPTGGFTVWVELPEHVDGPALRELALERNISIAPGDIFSARGGYRNYVRIGWGGEWSGKVAQGVAELGKIRRGLATAKQASRPTGA